MQRNIRLVLEYDGTFFKGWQIQPKQRTVQGELEARLERLCSQPVRVIASGRTDTGVHAQGQVVNFKWNKDISLERLQHALNGMLPADVAVLAADEVPSTFHARFDARRRTYLYQIRQQKQALRRDQAWWIRRPLDVAAMQEAASALVGHHDFTSFCVAAFEKEKRDCQVFDCTWQALENGLQFRMEANRFLRAMVRSIVGTLVEIGRGIRLPSAIPQILAAQNRQSAGESAPPQGLFLNKVLYVE